MEWCGDILLIPSDSLNLTEWNYCTELYKWISEEYNSTRIAKYYPIDNGIKRESHTIILYPKDADGYTSIKQNGIYYNFDITKVMFSSGNVSERIRMGKLNCNNEIVFDLYCGIGYFTLPILKYGNPNHLYGCDINVNSIKALENNLHINNIDKSKYTLLLGDNKETTKYFSNCCDRVLLGLLPSSESGWEIAIRLLNIEGGHLHVHENVNEKEYDKWIEYLINKLSNIAIKYNKKYEIKLEHLETVKSYSPHINHVVADMICKKI